MILAKLLRLTHIPLGKYDLNVVYPSANLFSTGLTLMAFE